LETQGRGGASSDVSWGIHQEQGAQHEKGTGLADRRTPKHSEEEAVTNLSILTRG